MICLHEFIHDFYAYAVLSNLSFQGHGVVGISFTGHPVEFCFFISPSTSRCRFRYFVRCLSNMICLH
jgi:hypothetical protein